MMSPQRDRFRLAGADGPIEIRRNESGILEVQAESLVDAIRGQGLAHAVDRGLQMLFMRILARGELSLRLDSSDESLAIDTFFRRLGLDLDVDREWRSLSPGVRTVIEAYLDGVAQGFERVGTPWELRLLGYRIGDDAWSWRDVVLNGKVIGFFGLASSQGTIERWIVECVQSGVDRRRLEELFPGRLEDLDEEAVRRVRLGQRVIPDAIWKLSAVTKTAGSNNWVVDGRKSTSGKPIVCNDPHLEVNRLPSVFHETVLRWTDAGTRRYVMGASLPGTPGIATGRTPDLAWSITYAYLDSLDSWIEDCRDGKYRRGEDWVDFEKRVERIERKGKPAVEVEFFDHPEHGTLDGDPRTPGYALCTRWSNRDGTAASSLAALLALLDARSTTDGMKAVVGFDNSGWCLIFGDRQGSIGYRMTGRMPLRRERAGGLAPLPGWDPANDWRGFVPPDDLPQAFDPPEGFLVTANDDLNHLGRAHPITLTLVPYRAKRIRDVLASRDVHSIDDMKALQYDLISLQALEYLPLLLETLEPHREHPNAGTLFEWDGAYRLESVAPTLFEQFYRALFEEVFTSGLGARGDDAVRHMLDRTSMINEYYALFDRVMLAEHSLWFGGRTRAEVYRAALERSKLLECEPRPWSEVERVGVRHILLGGKLPRFLGFDRGPISLPGGRATVAQGQISYEFGRAAATGASIRIISDLSDDLIRMNLPGGPSDRRFSPWYVSDLRNWLDGIYKVIDGIGGGD
ncbi:MAG: penicillin acylase family protein [Isosphaeraceae bacterium]|nr:penicillin acylase family protein [Isosphaeraceae bacterium]